MQQVFSITSKSYTTLDAELKGLIQSGSKIIHFEVTYDTNEQEYAMFVLYE